MGWFTRSERADNDEAITVRKQLLELQRELEAVQRRVDAVDLHARAIVEEAKRLINKFERRLDRETPDKPAQDAPARANGGDPYLGPSRRNY